MSLRAILPLVLRQLGYFEHASLVLRHDMFGIVRLPPTDVVPQFEVTAATCFVSLSLIMLFMVWLSEAKIKQKKIVDLRLDVALYIF